MHLVKNSPSQYNVPLFYLGTFHCVHCYKRAWREKPGALFESDYIHSTVHERGGGKYTQRVVKRGHMSDIYFGVSRGMNHYICGVTEKFGSGLAQC